MYMLNKTQMGPFHTVQSDYSAPFPSEGEAGRWRARVCVCVSDSLLRGLGDGDCDLVISLVAAMTAATTAV